MRLMRSAPRVLLVLELPLACTEVLHIWVVIVNTQSSKVILRVYLNPRKKDGITFGSQITGSFCKLHVDCGSARLVCCVFGCIVSFIYAGKHTEHPGKKRPELD